LWPKSPFKDARALHHVELVIEIDITTQRENEQDQEEAETAILEICQLLGIKKVVQGHLAGSVR